MWHVCGAVGCCTRIAASQRRQYERVIWVPLTAKCYSTERAVSATFTSTPTSTSSTGSNPTPLCRTSSSDVVSSSSSSFFCDFWLSEPEPDLWNFASRGRKVKMVWKACAVGFLGFLFFLYRIQPWLEVHHVRTSLPTLFSPNSHPAFAKRFAVVIGSR